MGHVFYDIFSILNVSFMHLKFYLGHHSETYGLQIGSYTYHIGILLFGDMRYTFLDTLYIYFLRFSLFCSFSI